MSEDSNKRKEMESPADSSSKKPRPPPGFASSSALVLATDRSEPSKQNALIAADGATGAHIKRTSSLMAPTMELSGHKAAVYASKFNPSGSLIASGSFDKQIFLWQVLGECKNTQTLTDHKSAVLDLSWTYNGERLYSASADKTGMVWDMEKGCRVKTLRDHTGFVNSICAARRGDPLLVTGADDGCVKLWDERVRGALSSFSSPYQVTCVCFSDDHSQVFAGGIDDVITCWDLRTGQPTYALSGHQDTITGIELSPDGSFLLSNAMDNSLRIWDVRPFNPNPSRMVKAFFGARHDIQKNLLRCSWSPDGKRVAAGSADRMVCVWDVPTTRLLYRLPGHAGAVVEVDFHPTEPIIVSGSLDKKLLLGEIEST